MHKIPASNLPTANKLLKAALEIAGGDSLVFSAYGKFVATGLHIGEGGLLHIDMVHVSKVAWGE